MKGIIYKWCFPPDVSATKAAELSNKLKIHPVVSKLLLQKTIDEEEYSGFLNPRYENISSPFLFKDMEKAVLRIERAIKNHEKIVIYGDYDADGVCATAILTKALEKAGAEVVPFIPNRLEEGYGLCVDNIKRLGEFSLIITVDNGVRSTVEVDYVNKMGKHVIVTDHHPPGPELPAAYAIINPHLENSLTPLAGCGVAFQLIRALGEKFPAVDPWNYIDIAAIGTYADIVPLSGDNRIIVKEGIKKISEQNHAGITSLLLTAGRKPASADEYDLGFVLGPRLNSAGRKGDASAALEILSVFDDFKAASVFATELESYNNWRRKEMERIENEAQELISLSENDFPAIILEKSDWHLGILGLGASRLSESFNKPAILLKKTDEFLKGSGRSHNRKFDMIKNLEKCSNCLETYGGHSQAVGVTLKKEKYSEFREKFFSLVCDSKRELDFDKTLEISDRHDPTFDDFRLYEDIMKLSPFGYCNEKPVFLASEVAFVDVREVGCRHLKMTLLTKRGKVDSIGFGLGGMKDDVLGKKGDVVYNLGLNIFNGRKKIQANIKDLRIGKE